MTTHSSRAKKTPGWYSSPYGERDTFFNTELNTQEKKEKEMTPAEARAVLEAEYVANNEGLSPSTMHDSDASAAWRSLLEEALAVVRKDLSGQRISPGTSQAEEEEMAPDDTIRTFDTGATRDSELGKFDYEGFLSPCVLERYAEYMDKHRVQSDGKLRDSDNWQKGIPVTAYTKSLWRHFFDVWKIHRGYQVFDPKGGHAIDQEEALCGLIFNAMGLLHTLTDDREFLPEETSS